MTFSMISRLSSSCSISGACWVETTTVSTRTGRSFSSYSTVTWLLPSGRSQESWPLRRHSESLRVMRCASAMGMGMYSGVSSQAKPNIMPWSPAPMSFSPTERPSSAALTPCAMSGLWPCSAVSTAQVLPSKPYLARS